jgi:hypothetical protein
MKTPTSKQIVYFFLRLFWLFFVFLIFRGCFLFIFQEKKFDFEKATKIVKYIQKNNIKNWEKHLKNNPDIDFYNKELYQGINIQEEMIIFQTASFIDDVVGYIYVEDAKKIVWRINPVKEQKNWYFGEIFLE